MAAVRSSPLCWPSACCSRSMRRAGPPRHSRAAYLLTERTFVLRKQVLVSVDRGETRVALLEATGQPTKGKQARPPRRATQPRPAKKDWRVAELYLERRGQRSIVGNIYKGRVDNVLPGLEA